MRKNKRKTAGKSFPAILPFCNFQMNRNSFPNYLPVERMENYAFPRPDNATSSLSPSKHRLIQPVIDSDEKTHRDFSTNW